GAAGEHLVAVDHPLVAVEDRPRAQRREVGTRFGLRVADGEVDLAGEDAGEEERLLLVGAEPHDRRPDRVERHERERRPRPLHLVEEDELVGGRAPLTPVLGGPADPEPPVRAHPPHEVPERRGPLPRLSELGAHLGRQQPGEVFAQLLAQRLLLGGVLQQHRTSSKSTRGWDLTVRDRREDPRRRAGTRGRAPLLSTTAATLLGPVSLDRKSGWATNPYARGRRLNHFDTVGQTFLRPNGRSAWRQFPSGRTARSRRPTPLAIPRSSSSTASGYSRAAGPVGRTSSSRRATRR